MKKIVHLLLLASSFLFSGCAEKEQQIVFKDKPVCVEQQKIERPQSTQIRVHNDDIDVAVAYKTAIYGSLDFYEKQVDRNNNFCKEIEKLNESGWK